MGEPHLPSEHLHPQDGVEAVAGETGQPGGKFPTADEYCVFAGQKKVGEFPEDAAEPQFLKNLNAVDRPRNPYWKPVCRDYGDDAQQQIAYLRDQLGD